MLCSEPSGSALSHYLSITVIGLAMFHGMRRNAPVVATGLRSRRNDVMHSGGLRELPSAPGVCRWAPGWTASLRGLAASTTNRSRSSRPVLSWAANAFIAAARSTAGFHCSCRVVRPVVCTTARCARSTKSPASLQATRHARRRTSLEIPRRRRQHESSSAPRRVLPNVAACRGRPPMPSSTTTRGGTIAAVYSRCQSERDLRIRHGQAWQGPL